MNARHRLVLLGLLGSVGLAACATKSDLQQVQTDIALFKAEAGRRDSARAAQLDELIRMQRGLYDSLASVTLAVGRLKGDLAADLYNIQQQMVQLQELTGQGQQALSRLRAQLEARLEQMQSTAAATDTGAARPRTADSDEEMYNTSLDQFHRGNASTSRLGMQALLQTYPTSPRVADALYYIGHSFDVDNPDSAAYYYRQVVDRFSTSPRAPSALYNLAAIAAARKDNTKVRELYRQIIDKYPKSYEAEQARDKLSKMPSR